MTNFSKLSSWLASIACGVCLVFAALATPGVAKADPPACDCCGTEPNGSDPALLLAWQDCMNSCGANGGVCLSDTVCNVTCHGTWMSCDGACNAKPACVTYRCYRLPVQPACECKAGG